ncbi:hypothetical protein B0H17DRAFT_1193440 [Mycena rosella]|uniref:Uncharacterized protein n=1 Tax=Mycena rosella TaxID=1033263 RepID=A0AAD7GTN4_MYCRO|nr:hypothetical protein B0H17DRAFT_1193440 [Mycena rosella]
MSARGKKNTIRPRASASAVLLISQLSLTAAPPSKAMAIEMEMEINTEAAGRPTFALRLPSACSIYPTSLARAAPQRLPASPTARLRLETPSAFRIPHSAFFRIPPRLNTADLFFPRQALAALQQQQTGRRCRRAELGTYGAPTALLHRTLPPFLKI